MAKTEEKEKNKEGYVVVPSGPVYPTDSDSDIDDTEVVNKSPLHELRSFRLVTSDEGRIVISKPTDMNPLGISFEIDNWWITWSEVPQEQRDLLGFEEVQISAHGIRSDLKETLAHVQAIAGHTQKLLLKGELKVSLLRRILKATQPSTISFSQHDFPADYQEFKLVPRLEIACRSAEPDQRAVFTAIMDHSHVQLQVTRINPGTVNGFLLMWSQGQDDFQERNLLFYADNGFKHNDANKMKIIENLVPIEENDKSASRVCIQNAAGFRATVKFVPEGVEVSF